jgi:hypothetical protein
MKNKYFVLVAIAFVVVLLWLVHSNRVRRLQRQREAVYRGDLQQFQRGLRLGMPRSEVVSYLDSRLVDYSTINQSLDVKIGEDPGDGIVCRNWTVYVEMSFARLKGQVDASPLDNLDGISIRRIGTCL